MSKAWAGGSTRQWRRIRAAVLDRDGHTCRIGLPGCLIVADCVHHTIGRAITGDDPAFLVAACGWCNRKIGQPGRRRRAPARPAASRTAYDRW